MAENFSKLSYELKVRKGDLRIAPGLGPDGTGLWLAILDLNETLGSAFVVVLHPAEAMATLDDHVILGSSVGLQNDIAVFSDINFVLWKDQLINFPLVARISEAQCSEIFSVSNDLFRRTLLVPKLTLGLDVGRYFPQFGDGYRAFRAEMAKITFSLSRKFEEIHEEILISSSGFRGLLAGMNKDFGRYVSDMSNPGQVSRKSLNAEIQVFSQRRDIPSEDLKRILLTNLSRYKTAFDARSRDIPEFDQMDRDEKFDFVTGLGKSMSVLVSNEIELRVEEYGEFKVVYTPTEAVCL